MKRFYIITILLLFFIFCFPCVSFGLSDDVVDTSQAVYSIYDSFNADMLVRVYNLSNGTISQKYAYNRIVGFFKNPDYSYFVTYKTWSGDDYYNSFAYNQTTLYLNFYKKSGLTVQSAPIDNWSLINTGVRILSSSSSIISFEFVSDEVEETTYSNNSFYLPNILVNYYPQTTVDFVSAINNNDTYLLQQIVTNSSRTATATEKIQEILEDKTVSDSSYNQSSVTVPDSSSTDLSGAFSTLKNVFVGGSDVDIVLPVPFVNKSITIDSSFVRDALVDNGGSVIVTLVELAYYFVLSVFIVKDVNRYLTKLKNGSIADSNENNIKAEIL